MSPPPRIPPPCLSSHFLLLLLLLLLPLPTTIAYPTATPDEMNMDTAVLHDMTHRLQNLTDHKFIPGAIAMVARDGKVVYESTVGYTRDDMLFRLFSMGKPITTTAVLMLLEEGKIASLDDPISKYIPAFTNMHVLKGANPLPNFYQTVPAKSPITIRHLLTHTSGLAYGYTNTTVDIIFRRGLLTPYARKTIPLSHFVSELAKLPLLFHPGTHCWYSLSYEVLGYLVEAVSGQPLDCFLSDRIFKPLHMIDTGFWVPPEKIDRLTDLMYMNGSSSPLFTVPNSRYIMNGYDFDPPLKLGGSGLVSTAKDYMHFCLFLFHGGVTETGERLVRRENIEHLFQDELPQMKPFAMNRVPHPNLTFAFAPQLQMVETGESAKGEMTIGGFANTKAVISRERGLIFLTMTQKVPFPNHAAQVVRECSYNAQRDWVARGGRKEGPGESVQEDSDRRTTTDIAMRLPFLRRDNPFWRENEGLVKRRLEVERSGEEGGREKERRHLLRGGGSGEEEGTEEESEEEALEVYRRVEEGLMAVGLVEGVGGLSQGGQKEEVEIEV